MPFAFEAYFDSQADAAVRGVWDELGARGIQSLAETGQRQHRPHISLAICDLVECEVAHGGLSDVLRRRPPVRLRLSYMAAFAGYGGVAFLGVAPTIELVDLHSAVRDAVRSAGSGWWPHYEAGCWIPHCTLAQPFDLGRFAELAEAAGAALPIEAQIACVGIVDVSTGEAGELVPLK